MLIKIQKEKLSIKVELVDSASFDQLVQVLNEKLLVNELEHDVLVGYPPKIIKARGCELLRDLGVLSGGVLTIRHNEKKKTLSDNLVSMGFDAAVCRMVFASLDVERATVEVAINLAIELAASAGVTESKQPVTRKIIDADNSCLFNAIGYLLMGEKSFITHFNPMSYRKIVAEAVQQDEVTYNAEMLGKPAAEYAAWIVNPDKWGGEIELFVLAKHFGVEIAAVDIRTGNLLVYGERRAAPGATAGENKTEEETLMSSVRRIYVIYDGVHYDAAIRAKGPLPGLGISAEITVFSPQDAETQAEVLALAAALRESKQFVNLSTGSLQCKVCFAVLGGEAAAVEHAKLTGHQNFGQV